jgi:hypothetical protein
MAEPRLSCRPATTDDDAKAIFVLLLEMAKEVARTHIEYNKGFVEIYRIVKEQAAYVVEDGTGLAVASVGLTLHESGPWYGSDVPFYSEQWFYVLPALRGGQAIGMLEAEIKALVDATGHPAYVKYFNPSSLASTRRKVPVGEERAYIPAGRIVRFAPAALPGAVPVIGN